MTSEPFISIIILNWNRPQDTMEVLTDLQSQTYENREIILVDNASEDGSADAIEDEYKDVKVIRADRNLGVPGGRNLGIENARGELLVFLDNDAFLEPEGLVKIVDSFDGLPDVGIISLHIVDYFTGDLDLASWVYSKTQISQASQRFITHTFCGCGFAVRRRLFEELGLLQGGFFFCGEEDEFAIRAIKQGYDIQYCGDIIVRHKTSPQGRYEGASRVTYCLRNRLLTIWAYYPFWQAVRLTFLRFAVDAEKGRRAGSLAVVPKGVMEALRLRRQLNLPRRPMDKETWNRYQNLYINLKMRWWQRSRIHEEFGDSLNQGNDRSQRKKND